MKSSALASLTSSTFHRVAAESISKALHGSRKALLSHDISLRRMMVMTSDDLCCYQSVGPLDSFSSRLIYTTRTHHFLIPHQTFFRIGVALLKYLSLQSNVPCVECGVVYAHLISGSIMSLSAINITTCTMLVSVTCSDQIDFQNYPFLRQCKSLLQ